ncbi:uncharacterized protein YjiS (DUF1127 family) [Pseudomonas duriflava]|uniref:Uncharacterized protein YjiS (DUF1127 family) n=1 Tax=Pseudomonas duriflava TaxID=459528 RepID=A0A562Q2V3_9PSED|nr:DUF1127 domain-containing protein [Pseudomonas duriflava]TWI51009.1 uncharacterized protein YjiS (DUF1127 family) [Pseudomonas duriflava]
MTIRLIPFAPERTSIAPHDWPHGSLWRRLIARFERWRMLSRQRHQLAMLSDETLKDLGLSRADVIQESERPFWDDPFSR